MKSTQQAAERQHLPGTLVAALLPAGAWQDTAPQTQPVKHHHRSVLQTRSAVASRNNPTGKQYTGKQVMSESRGRGEGRQCSRHAVFPGKLLRWINLFVGTDHVYWDLPAVAGDSWDGAFTCRLCRDSSPRGADLASGHREARVTQPWGLSSHVLLHCAISQTSAEVLGTLGFCGLVLQQQLKSVSREKEPIHYPMMFSVPSSSTAIIAQEDFS